MSVEYNRDPWPQEKIDLNIEKVEKYHDNDNAFFTELRVLSGPQKGELKRQLWFRLKINGEPRKDSKALMEALASGIDSPSYDLVGKSFSCEPWYPPEAKYPFFTKIQAIETADPWQ